MRPWFEGEGTLACDLETVATALESPGQFFVQTAGLMPGISEAQLVEEGDGFVTIRTNEGLMKRTGILVHTDPAIRIKFDEVYEAGSLATVTSHYLQEFVPVDAGVRHRLVISVLEAPGLLGLAYRWLASGNIGRAVLEAHRQHFDGDGD